MARLPDLIEFAKEHGLKIGTIADLIHYRSQQRKHRRARRRAHDADRARRLPRRSPTATSRAAAPTWRWCMATSQPRLRDAGARAPAGVDAGPAGNRRHHALVEHGVGAWRRSSAAERGVMVLLNCGEIGRADVRAVRRAGRAADPRSRARARMDLRTYGIGAQILKDLGVGKMRLLASPRKMPSDDRLRPRSDRLSGRCPATTTERHRNTGDRASFRIASTTPNAHEGTT